MLEYGSAFLRPVRLRIGSSRSLAATAAAAHAGAAAIALLMPLPLWGRSALLGLLLWSAWRVWSVHLGPGGRRISEVLLRSDDVFEVTTAAGIAEAQLLGAELVAPWLTVLRLRLGGGACVSLVLLPDNVEAQAFRRLRVRLRHRLTRPPGDADGIRDGEF